MSQLEYLIALISIIVGLGVTDLAQSVRELVRPTLIRATRLPAQRRRRIHRHARTARRALPPGTLPRSVLRCIWRCSTSRPGTGGGFSAS
jgi:hypothetical protein